VVELEFMPAARAWPKGPRLLLVLLACGSGLQARPLLNETARTTPLLQIAQQDAHIARQDAALAALQVELARLKEEVDGNNPTALDAPTSPPTPLNPAANPWAQKRRLQGSDVLGAVLAVVAAIISNVGVNLQKRSHNRMAKRPAHERVGFFSDTSWWTGYALVIFGAIFDFLALGFAMQSLVTAIGGASTLVANLFISHYWLKETLSNLDLIGVAFICIGAAGIASIAPAGENYELQQLEKLAAAPKFITYLVVLCGVICALFSSIANSKVYKWRTRITESILRPIIRSFKEQEVLFDFRLAHLETKCAELEYRLDEQAMEVDKVLYVLHVMYVLYVGLLYVLYVLHVLYSYCVY
jgi:multidrug transporter EmrE-like cation transporter